jgi:uncharacterized protein (TIGR03437 family)
MAYDSAHSQIVLFGGTNEATLFNDTWVWDGTNWTQKFPQTSPPGRSDHAMTYDAVHGQVVLFGGSALGVSGALVYLTDTWTWDGTNWTLQSPATSPPVLSTITAIAYDSARSQVVLLVAGEQTADTWIWDGSNWTKKSPQSSAPYSYDYAIAFDSVHSQIVAWVSTDFSTWVWDGSNWTKKTSQLSPNASLTAVMAYDSLNSEAILLTDFDQTFAWDGASWTLKSPQNSLLDNLYCMAYDPSNGVVVLFGGVLPGGGDLNDTWTWQGGPPPAPLPAITSVVSASGFGGFSAVAPGSWVEIYGSNLAPDTRQWAGSDFNGNDAPTSLDGVVVNIGGQKAFIDYISSSPGQVNAQLPSNIATGGQLGVTLTNSNGTSSAFNITVNSTEPGLLAPSSFAIGGKQYAVALLPDNATYVLPTGAIPGVASRPAQPGETITLYGIGFGAVSPNIPAGQIVGQANQLAASFQILFGQTAAQVAYAGLAPGFVGLYQFDVVVPAVPDNNLVPLTFDLAGVAGTQTLYTSVHQ